MNSKEELEKFKKTKYWNYLLSWMKGKGKEVDEFNDEFTNLWNHETDEMGVILKSHLMIESYLDRYLVISYPTITQWTAMRLTFNQKLEMCSFKGTMIQFYCKCIKELNTVRNKFAHKTSYRPISTDYSEIRKMMTIWANARKQPIPKENELIFEFVLQVCNTIHTDILSIQRHGGGLGLPGYLKWLQEMQEPI